MCICNVANQALPLHLRLANIHRFASNSTRSTPFHILQRLLYQPATHILCILADTPATQNHALLFQKLLGAFPATSPQFLSFVG